MALILVGDNGVSLVSGSAGTPALQGTDTNTGISFGTDTVNLVTGGTTRATVDSSGRLGIATTTPGSLDAFGDDLVIGDGSGHRGATIYSGTGSQGVIYFADGTSGGDVARGKVFYSHSDNYLAFDTNASERMRITSGGNLCVNSTGSDNSTGGPLCITGRSAQGMSTWNIGQNGFPALYFNNASGSKVGDIVVNSGSTAYNTSSDYRLKENIVLLNSAAERNNQLQVRRFNFIAEFGTTVDCFIAHEAQAVVPEAVTGTQDEVEVWKEGEELPDGVSVGDNKLDEDGNPIPKYQGIDQSKLVPLLTAALQEALAKIETLETRLTALEGGAS